MKAKLYFPIKYTDSIMSVSKILVEESLLQPGNGFLPEDREKIAITHAKHLQTYLTIDQKRPSAFIALKVGPEKEDVPSNCCAKGSVYELLHSGKKIVVQTLFFPTNYKISADYASTSLKVIRLVGTTYEEIK